MVKSTRLKATILQTEGSRCKIDSSDLEDNATRRCQNGHIGQRGQVFRCRQFRMLPVYAWGYWPTDHQRVATVWKLGYSTWGSGGGPDQLYFLYCRFLFGHFSYVSIFIW
jgi:hypothetical protein